MRRSRIAWLGVVAGAIGSAVLSAAECLADEALDQTLRHRGDGYVLDLTVARHGEGSEVTTARKDKKTSSIETQWSFAPTLIKIHLLPRLRQSTVWNATRSLYSLTQWEQQVDQELARIQQVRQVPNHPMRAFADEDERVTRAAAAHLDDVEALLRLLHGIDEYSYIGDDGGDPAQPTSRAPEITFGGGDLSTTIRDFAGKKTSDRQDYPAWTAETLPVVALNSAKSIGLIVWQFDPDDMARARALMADLDKVGDDLTYQGENVRTDLIDKRINLDWKTLAQVSHARFRDALIGALRDVARYAWALAPEEPPAGLFAQGPRAELWLGELAPDAALTLPEIAGNRLMRLAMPVGGLNTKHLGMMGGSWLDSTRTDFKWIYEFPPQPLSAEPSSTVALRDSATSNSEHTVFMKDGVISLIDAEFSDDRATGTITQAASHQATSEAQGNNGMVDIVEHADDQVSLEWTVSYEPAPASPEEEPMTLSFARPVEGKAVPFDGSEIDYGEAFYVEGHLTKPATRKVYRIKMDVSGGQPQDVFLRPVEGDPTLLRSDVLYVMWDVTKQGAAP